MKGRRKKMNKNLTKMEGQDRIKEKSKEEIP
jgi:hypothetical protein